MIVFASICALTTAIAIASVFSGSKSRALPGTGGILLGIAFFWVLPEIREDGGWLPLAGVVAVLCILLLIDRYVYPICPFCAVGIQTDRTRHRVLCGQTIQLGWPLVAIGCLHSFMDGWTIGLARVSPHAFSGTALSLGTTVHKIPESVAIGILSARLAPTRSTAFRIIALLQIAMAAGGALSISAGRFDISWAGVCVVPAGAFLLLFGILALEQEWRLHGGASAALVTAPGLLGCAIAALAMKILPG